MSPRTEAQNEEIRREKRKQILDAAFELFANEGYTKTSISSVAKKAGISKGLIYHYFDSKEAILEGIFAQLVELGDEMLEATKEFPALMKIRKIIEYTFQFIEQEIDTARLMMSLALQPEAFSSLHRQINYTQETQLKQYIEIFEKLGYEEPEMEAYELGATLDGIMLGYISMGDKYPIEELKAKIIQKYASA